jgi:glycosyltransferase involved in cell wall biosynthesis
MKVFVDPIPNTLSLAMHRVAGALKRYAPPEIRVVQRPEDADLQVMHVIGLDSMDPLRAPRYAVIQYCLCTTGISKEWSPIWAEADLVWSYYDLVPHMDGVANFYQSPLGGDDAFMQDHPIRVRDIGVVTSGYVTGPGAEAIEEVAIAASLVGLKTVHLGPIPTGMKQIPRGWKSVHRISDEVLASFYHRSLWVSGLRYVEGFELPAVEGLLCGARPILFDRKEMWRWYGEHGVFVPELHGTELVKLLVSLFENGPQEVSDEELAQARKTFNWEQIAEGFWQGVLAGKAVSV